MDKYFVMVLTRDIETAMKVIAEGLDKDDMVLVQEAFKNAEKEFATLRRLLRGTSPDVRQQALKP